VRLWHHVFADEHPDSLNDGVLAVACTGAEPNDPPGSAYIIDYPASHHSGAGVFSFADGGADLHQWRGATIQPPVKFINAVALNTPARDSSDDIKWLASNTTVKR
jgi:hypothetical protein